MFRWRGFWFKLYLQLHGCKVGKGLKCLSRPRFREVPYRNIEIGDYVTIGRWVTFEIGREGKLILDDRALLADNIILSTHSEIYIGKWTAIAENVSIRGTFHDMAKNTEYRKQGSGTKPIRIEEDAGIGAGCVVLMGSVVPKGTFIGSNSTVTGSKKLEPYSLYAGHPLKLIRKRT